MSMKMKFIFFSVALFNAACICSGLRKLCFDKWFHSTFSIIFASIAALLFTILFIFLSQKAHR